MKYVDIGIEGIGICSNPIVRQDFAAAETKETQVRVSPVSP